MRRRGFTLAELLLALVILGVIATFTLPKVLSSQMDSKKKAIFKESIATLQVITINMVRSNDLPLRSHACGTVSSLDPDSYANYLNYLKRTDVSPTQTRYELTNGSEVTVFIGNVIDLRVDYDGPGMGPNTYGQDRVVFHFNDCDGTYVGTLPSGRFGLIPAQPAGFVAENQALWEDIFKN